MTKDSVAFRVWVPVGWLFIVACNVVAVTLATSPTLLQKVALAVSICGLAVSVSCWLAVWVGQKPNDRLP